VTHECPRRPQHGCADDVGLEVPRANDRLADVEFLLSNLGQIDRLVLVDPTLAVGQGEEGPSSPGIVGVGAGAFSTAIYAATQHWAVTIPTLAWTGGLPAALVIGALAGLWPARRAARRSPTQALWAM
jgi:hypothetical protein